MLPNISAPACTAAEAAARGRIPARFDLHRNSALGPDRQWEAGWKQRPAQASS